MINVEALRASTPGCAHVTHLNNAGCALPPAIVTDTMVSHLRLEEAIGLALKEAILGDLEKHLEAYRSGVVSDACSLARTLLWGFGKDRTDTRSQVQVRQDAFAALERYGIDPAEVLAGVR